MNKKGSHSYSEIQFRFQHQKNYDVHGIRVNGICPTRVDTEFLKQVNPIRPFLTGLLTKSE